MAFSLLTPEYFKALRLQYYVLGTTGLDKTLVHRFSHEALPKVLAFPPKSTCCEPRLPCLEGSEEHEPERRSRGGRWSVETHPVAEISSCCQEGEHADIH